MAENLRAVALSLTDVRTVLEVCSPTGLLVGGQALAFWADHLQVPPPSVLAPGLDADADFIGDAALAKQLADALGWTLWVPSLEDATPLTGRVSAVLKDGGMKQVDFFSGIAGLSSDDLFRRAIDLRIPDLGLLRVMHPLDVLDSRIQNLHALPEMRTATGIAQAGFAVAMAQAYIRRSIGLKGERRALRLLERVAGIAASIAAVRVFLLYGVDPLHAVPLEDFRTTSSLHTQRWPQISAQIQAKRAAVRALQR